MCIMSFNDKYIKDEIMLISYRTYFLMNKCANTKASMLMC